MTKEKGTISINTENIFPIIKKFLYSDHEIFLQKDLVVGIEEFLDDRKDVLGIDRDRAFFLGHEKGF